MFQWVSCRIRLLILPCISSKLTFYFIYTILLETFQKRRTDGHAGWGYKLTSCCSQKVCCSEVFCCSFYPWRPRWKPAQVEDGMGQSCSSTREVFQILCCSSFTLESYHCLLGTTLSCLAFFAGRQARWTPCVQGSLLPPRQESPPTHPHSQAVWYCSA